MPDLSVNLTIAFLNIYSLLLLSKNTNFSPLNNLSEIRDFYDVFLIDLWGVIHNGIAAFDNVMPVLQSLKQKKKMLKVQGYLLQNR